MLSTGFPPTDHAWFEWSRNNHSDGSLCLDDACFFGWQLLPHLPRLESLWDTIVDQFYVCKHGRCWSVGYSHHDASDYQRNEQWFWMGGIRDLWRHIVPHSPVYKQDSNHGFHPKPHIHGYWSILRDQVSSCQPRCLVQKIQVYLSSHMAPVNVFDVHHASGLFLEGRRTRVSIERLRKPEGHHSGPLYLSFPRVLSHSLGYYYNSLRQSRPCDLVP